MPRKGWTPSAETRARRAAWQAARQVPPLERLLSKVESDPNGGCWLWTGTLLNTGYGQIDIAGRGVSAHRLSFELHHGPIPPGLVVMHKCDVRACVNPDHLLVGTHRDNMADMARKGRASRRLGEDHSDAKISAADLLPILRRLANAEPCARIAADYGVTDCAINAIRRGRSWTHITKFKPVRFSYGDQGGTGANNSRSEAA